VRELGRLLGDLAIREIEDLFNEKLSGFRKLLVLSTHHLHHPREFFVSSKNTNQLASG